MIFTTTVKMVKEIMLYSVAVVYSFVQYGTIRYGIINFRKLVSSPWRSAYVSSSVLLEELWEI